MNKSKYPWIVAGGKPNELAHCQGCGLGLTPGPQTMGVVVGAMKGFEADHKGCKERATPRPPNPRYSWPNDRDTGISSMTIWSVFSHSETPYSAYDAPHDPDDFGRCYRLLKLFPEWRPRLSEVAKRFPVWEPFVSEWNRMTELYEEELPTGSAPKLYALMRSLWEGKA